MKFYTKQHQFYCGIDLHAHTMFVCILDQSGKICLEKNLHSSPDEFCPPSSLFAAILSSASNVSLPGIGSRICAQSRASPSSSATRST